MKPYQHDAALADALEYALDVPQSAGDANGLAADVAELVEVARALEYTASCVVPDGEFRTAARQRLLTEMARSSRAARPVRASLSQRMRMWALRLGTGLTALGLTGAAAASASANALPGEALYPVKQATEAVALQLATTEADRRDILLRQAETRLDEAARLLDEGRAADAAVTVSRYQATVSLLSEETRSEKLESDLRTNDVRLNALLETAPPPVRPGLERALTPMAGHVDRSRPNPAALPADVVPAVVEPTNTAPTREPHRPVRAADADERPADDSRGKPAAEHGRGADGPAAIRTPNPATEPAPADVPDDRPDVAPRSGSRDTRPANHPAPTTPVHGSGPTSEHGSPPHSQPGGRSRP